MMPTYGAFCYSDSGSAGARRCNILPACTLPLTGKACVDLIVTDLCVMACDRPGLRLIELAPGVTLDEVRAKTGAPFAEQPA